MQLVEYFLWKNIDNPPQRQLWSKIGAAIILAQPLFLMNLIPDQNLKLKLMTGYTVVVVGSWVASKKAMDTRVGENGHLIWDWFPKPQIWAVVWVVSWFLPLLLSGSWGFLALCTAAFIPSIYYYMEYATWGTMWCWFAIVAWVLYFFMVK